MIRLKQIITLLTLAVLMFGLVKITSAQEVTEYKTIDEVEGYYRDGDILFPAEYCPNTSYSYCNGVVRIFDSTFTCVKTVQLVKYSVTGDGNVHDYLGICCMSKNLFTNSNKYEFVVMGDFSTSDGDNYITNNFYGIYNEDGDLVFDFGGKGCLDGKFYDINRHWTWQLPFVVGNKLVVNYNDGPNGNKYYSKIFNIYGNANSSINPVIAYNQNSKLYPNPARNSVTLEYDIQGRMQEMQIVDINGRVVASYLLDPSQKQVNINTSNYKKGVYIYRYGNNSGKFVVE